MMSQTSRQLCGTCGGSTIKYRSLEHRNPRRMAQISASSRLSSEIGDFLRSLNTASRARMVPTMVQSPYMGRAMFPIWMNGCISFAASRRFFCILPYLPCLVKFVDKSP